MSALQGLRCLKQLIVHRMIYKDQVINEYGDVQYFTTTRKYHNEDKQCQPPDGWAFLKVECIGLTASPNILVSLTLPFSSDHVSPF